MLEAWSRLNGVMNSEHLLLNTIKYHVPLKSYSGKPLKDVHAFVGVDTSEVTLWKMMSRNLRPVVFHRQTTYGWVFLSASHFSLSGRPALTLTVHQTFRCYRWLLAPRLIFLHGGDGGFSGSIPVSV
ncbi:hypothetical protein Bca101_033883 [Brassica carinata]